MFYLLYEDAFLRRMTVLDTSDGIVETMRTADVLDIMKKNEVNIKGIAFMGLQYLAFAQPYPIKRRKSLPRNCFLITKIYIDKGEYSSRVVADGYDFVNGVIVKEVKSVLLKDDTDTSKFYFTDNVMVSLYDAYREENFLWTMRDGKCSPFKDETSNPYNANMGTEVCEVMWGDFICGFLRKGYVDLKDLQ